MKLYTGLIEFRKISQAQDLKPLPSIREERHSTPSKKEAMETPLFHPPSLFRQRLVCPVALGAGRNTKFEFVSACRCESTCLVQLKRRTQVQCVERKRPELSRVPLVSGKEQGL